MSWHRESCGIPDLSWDGGYPTCVRCSSSAFSIAGGAKETAPPPAPPPCSKRSQLTCSWPPCVEYSDAYIDEEGNDVTAFITENIDEWNVDAAEQPDDQTTVQEVRDASHQTHRRSASAELFKPCPTTSNADTSDEVVKTTHDKTHTAASSPISTHRSDRIYDDVSGLDDFRLLHLYGSASSGDPIHCSLQIAHLDDPDIPLYEALSYTWADLDGDKRNCMPIYIGGHFDVLLVTKNCQSALRRLRRRSDRLLWIDAICIDQNNSIERSAQVNHMSKIYSRASRVLIYLGEPSTGSEEALTMVATCSQASAILKDTAFLVGLAKRPYFNRLWIIQEVGLAARASVIYGGLMMHWTDLCSAFQSVGVAPGWIKHFSTPVHQRRMAPSIFELLRDTKDSLCFDPRDRLFGIIGLANTAERESLPIDYSLSVQQLYTGLAAYLIEKTDSRSILTLASNQRKSIPGLPSWVPDWTNIETQASGTHIPELLVDSPYMACPRFFWSQDITHRRRSRSIDVSIEDFSIDAKNPGKMELLMSPPHVLPTAGALLLYAVPLFRISHGELRTLGVAGGTRITKWRIHRDPKLFNHTDELETFVIPSCNGIIILKNQGAGIFCLQRSVSVRLFPLQENTEFHTLSNELLYPIYRNETVHLRRWLRVVLGLHLSSILAAQNPAGGESTHEAAAVFPDLSRLRGAEKSLAEGYQKSGQTGFNSAHFKAMDLMRTRMISAIDVGDLTWRSPVPSNLRNWRWNSTYLYEVEGFAEELPTRQKSIEEQISMWSSSAAQLMSQLQEQASFSDAFRDLQADPDFSPYFWVLQNVSDEMTSLLVEALGICNPSEGVMPDHVHLSLILQGVYGVISRATLDENLPWDYNRDRFWMCMVSFDLIVRMRLLLLERQFYAQMERSIRSSIANPKRIMIV